MKNLSEKDLERLKELQEIKSAREFLSFEKEEYQSLVAQLHGKLHTDVDLSGKGTPGVVEVHRRKIYGSQADKQEFSSHY